MSALHRIINRLTPVWQRSEYLPLDYETDFSYEIAEGDTVADELGRIGYVDEIDMSPYGGGMAAYVVFDGGKSADWISLNRLMLLDSAVDEALSAVNEWGLKKALVS